MVFTIFEPGPVGRVPVMRFFPLGYRGIFVLDCLPHLGEQALGALRQPIGLMHSARRVGRQTVKQIEQFLLLPKERYVDGEARGISMQRERMVSGKTSGIELRRRSRELLGGSSSVFRNAFAAWVTIRSASEMTATLRRPSLDRIWSACSRLRIWSIESRAISTPGWRDECPVRRPQKFRPPARR